MHHRIVRVLIFVRYLLLLLLPAMLGVEAQAVVRYDMTKAELLQELGKPVSVMKQPSGREVLLYPNKVRIEVEKDRVVSIKGIDIVAAEAAETATAEAKVAAEEEARQRAADEKLEAARAAARAKAEKEWADQNAKARLEMEKSVEAMENRTATPGVPHMKKPEFSLIAFLFGLAVKWLLMVGALKLTTKYWAVDVDWSGILIAAGADTAVRGVLGLVAEFALHTPSLFYVDEAIAAVVLVLVLRKVSTNQSLNQAVTITFTVKTFSIVVGSVVMVGLMGLMH